MSDQLSKVFLLSCLFFGQTLLAQNNTNYDLLLQSGTILLTENGHELDKLPAPNAAELFEGYYLRLIQFYELPDRFTKTKLKNTGIHFLNYIPNKAFITAIPENFDWTKLAEANIRSVAAIQTKWKMGENLRNETYGEWALDGNHLEVTFTFPEMYTLEQIEIACIDHGITILETSRYAPSVKAQIPIDEITQIAALPFIYFLEMKQKPGEPEDIRGRSLHRSNMIDSPSPSGYHFNGEGVKVQVRDNGFIGPHIDFHGRVDNSFETSGQSGDHQTPVSGTLGGAGNIDPNAKGMADGVFLYGTNYSSSFGDVMNMHLNNDVVIANSSYSDGCNNGYMTNTEQVDEQIYNNPTLIHVFSAGNANPSNCGYGAGNQWGNITGGHKQGKNVMTVASTNSSGQIAGSSSRGPAHDGRIKPDISAHGSGVYTPKEGNNYQNISGTSFSSPNAAGVLAQLYQAYKTWNNGENPESALIKAALLNTANDLGQPGPDYIYGWGHLNAFRAMKIIEENRYFSANVEQNKVFQQALIIPAEVKQARIMVYWSDTPGTPFSAKALVNNLDMELSTPDGEVLLPYILNPAPNQNTLNAPATNGVDNLNNMEQVVIDLPAAGEYTLTVLGVEVPADEQKFYVLWELITDDIVLTYPNGGECFSQSGSQVIHWDAHSKDGEFLLEYSLDNGALWETITTKPGSARLHSWGVPDFVTGKALIRISNHGIIDQSDTTFSIMNTPDNLQVMAACSDALTISWDAVPEATSYTLYKLGNRYMDSVNISTTTTGTIPISDPYETTWYAVSANGPDNACSNRTFAQNHKAGFLNCIPNNDISVSNQVCGGANIICANEDSRLRIGIVNHSMTDASDIKVGYRINNGAPRIEDYSGTVLAGETATHTFSQLINLGAAGYTIRAWVHKADDDTFLNDTIAYTLISKESINLPFQERFPTFDFPADKWTNKNPDNGIGWDIKLVRSPFEGFTQAAYMNNIGNQAGSVDDFISHAIDLTDVHDLVLTFDVAYAGFNEVQQDTLLIEVISVCGEECFAEAVYYKGGADLSTAPNKQTPWVPLNETQWRHESVDLTPYLGQIITIKFSNISGKGNAMCIDNINMEEVLVSSNQQNIDFSFKLAPNPGMEKVNLLLSDIQQRDYQLEWYGVQGQLLKQQQIQSETGSSIHSIETSDLPSGVYWIKLIHETGALTNKWVKL